MTQPESISRSTRPWTLLGFACLAATLLLTSPGVEAVRADDGAPVGGALVSEAPPAPSCSAAQAEPLARIQQQIVLPARVAMNADGGAGGLRMLNSRGYNYGPVERSPEREQQVLEREFQGR
jgi:hypothetical protein